MRQMVFGLVDLDQLGTKMKSLGVERLLIEKKMLEKYVWIIF